MENTEQNYKVYIADCSPQGGIYYYAFTKGKLLFKQKISLDRPMYLAVEKNRLYAILRAPYTASADSGILSFTLDVDGRLKDRSELVSTEGVVCCHLCVRNGEVFSANYLSGSVNKLGEKTVIHKGKGVHPVRQEAAHVHFVNISPDGAYLLCCDLGLDTIYVYDFNLNPVSAAKVPQGHGVRHLAYASDGRTIYSVNELKSTISIFDYQNGRLSYQDTVKGLPDDFQGENTAAAIKIYENRLYISHRGYDGISVFDISSKVPVYLTSFHTGGKSPRDFEVIDRYLIVTNESGMVTVFDRETYSCLQELKLESPLCVIYC